MSSVSGVKFVFYFCLVFVFLLSLKPRPFVQSSFVLRSSFFVLRYACAPTATRSYLTTVCVLFLLFCFFLFFFFFLDMSLFPSFFVPLLFSLCMESTSYVFPFRMVFFCLVTASWVFDIISLCENSINESTNQHASLSQDECKNSPCSTHFFCLAQTTC